MLVPVIVFGGGKYLQRFAGVGEEAVQVVEQLVLQINLK